jgi:hypothetical protein
MDERKQTEAVLVAWTVATLWLSRWVVTHFPDTSGNVDLREWLRFWNKPLWVNWPTATTIFLAGICIAKRLVREMIVYQLRRKEEEARWLANQTGRPWTRLRYRRIR